MTSNETTAVDARELRISEESVHSVARIWKAGRPALNWNCLFVLPAWMDAWLGSCAGSLETRIFAIRSGTGLAGLAPLQVDGSRAGLIGSPDLCDYLDFIVAKGHEAEFYGTLLQHLSDLGIRQLELGPLREDSSAFCDLSGIAAKMGWDVQHEGDEISYEMKLAASWEEYLSGLNGKQRHEVRRKLRRLAENADFKLRLVETPAELGEHFDIFLELFRQSRADKDEFLTQKRLAFFDRLTSKMAAAGMLRLYFLDIDKRPAAVALCFEVADTLYLYNSGYDPSFASLSAGQVCTFLSIKAAIANGLKGYNFLKGDEVYKKRLGGRPVQLVRLKLTK
jgi:CelD/BcsL family acetyltransferase involved in cellulose biosynthesis